MNRHKILVFITTVAILSTSIMPVNCYASEMDEEEFATEDVFGICDDRDYIPEVWAYAVEPYPEEEYNSDCPPASFDGDTGEYKEYDSMAEYISDNGPFPRNQGSMTIVIHNEEEKEIANEIFESNSTIVDKAKALESNGLDISCDVSYGNNTFKHEDDLEESLKYDEPVGQRAIPVEETDGDYDDIEYEEAKEIRSKNDKETSDNSDIVSKETKEKITDKDTTKTSSEIENISYDDNSGKYNGCTWNYDPVNKKLVIKSDTGAIINYTKDGSDFPWSKYKDEIEKIAIEGVSEIQANAFKDYPNVYKIYLNSSVSKLTAYAFTGCDSLTELYINGSPEVNENFYTYLDSNVTISCHYDMDANSIYNNCLNFNRNFEVIEGFDPKSMEDVEYIYQMDYRITTMSNGYKQWQSTACVTCTAAYMVERCAASNGYVGDYTFAGKNGDGKTGAIALVQKMTYEDNDSNLNYTWPTEPRTYNEFTKDSKPLTVTSTKNTSPTEDDLINAIKTHPEGVIAFINYTNDKGKKATHAVLVTGYNKLTKTYSIIDVGHKSSAIGIGANGFYCVTYDQLSNSGTTDSLNKIYYINNVL